MKTQRSYEEEIRAQRILWKRLQKWLVRSLLFSSCLVACIYAAHSYSHTASPWIIGFCVLLLLIDGIWMLLIARSLKHGKQNIEKLIQLLEAAQ